MHHKLILIAASLALTACSYPRPQTAGALPPLSALAAQQANPRLALLEHVLAEYFTSDISNRPTVCAAVNDGRSAEALATDDEVALIERFGRLAPLARCSQAAGGWRDAETEEPALVFTLHSFTCASDASCSGWAGYQAGAAASQSSLYRMEWRAGWWNVARDTRAIAQ